MRAKTQEKAATLSPATCITILERDTAMGKFPRFRVRASSFIHFSLSSVLQDYLTIQADNCTGQNKNFTVISYANWLVLSGVVKKIRISFMVTGHTKFAPDGHFGIVKNEVRCSEIHCVQHIAEAAQRTTNGRYIEAVDTRRIGFRAYRWTDFFNVYFKRFPGIAKFHHISFAATAPGIAYCRVSYDGEGVTFDMNRSTKKVPLLNVNDWNSPAEVLTPPGMTVERQNYLHKEIRPYVAKPFQDETAPKPKV
jgi:hypothetical protein